MIWRYKIVVLERRDLEATSEVLREMGLERWELLSVLPGSSEDPDDPTKVTGFFRRDASSEIGL